MMMTEAAGALRPRRCKCAVSWEATGGDSINPGCATRGALLAAATPGTLRRRRRVPHSYYQASAAWTMFLTLLLCSM